MRKLEFKVGNTYEDFLGKFRVNKIEDEEIHVRYEDEENNEMFGREDNGDVPFPLRSLEMFGAMGIITEVLS